MLKTKDGNVTIDEENSRYSAHDPDIQLPDSSKDEEQSVVYPVDPKGQNTTMISILDGGDEYSDMNMEIAAYYLNLQGPIRFIGGNPPAQYGQKGDEFSPVTQALVSKCHGSVPLSHNKCINSYLQKKWESLNTK